MVNDMRKSHLKITALALGLSLAGCADLVGLGYGNIVGEYDLKTLNGFQLPTVVYQDAFEQDELLSEKLTIYADGSYTDDYTLRVSSSAGQSTQSYRDVGTYTHYNDTQLQFVDGRTGDAFTGEISGRTLTVTQNGNFYVYQR
jgi:hypothetical protein